MKQIVKYTAVFASGIAAGFIGLVANDIAQQVRQEKAWNKRRRATVTDIRDAQ